MLSSTQRDELIEDVRLATDWLALAAAKLASWDDATTLIALALGLVAGGSILGRSGDAVIDGVLSRLRARAGNRPIAAEPSVWREWTRCAERCGLAVPPVVPDPPQRYVGNASTTIETILFGDERVLAKVCDRLEHGTFELSAGAEFALTARAYADLRRQRLVAGTQVVRVQLRRDFDRAGARDAIAFLRTQQRLAGHFGGSFGAASLTADGKGPIIEVVHTALVLITYASALDPTCGFIGPVAPV